MLTLSEIEQYIRAETGELDSKKVESIQITRWVNYAQIKVQTEFAKLDYKAFTKTAFHIGASFPEPDDLLKYPNSIIALLGSTGSVRAFTNVSYTLPDALITHTLREAGANGNLLNIIVDSETYITGLTAGQVSCIVADGKFYFDFGSGSTVTQIVNGFNNDAVYSEYFICSSLTTGSVVPIPDTDQELTLGGGVGTGYYPADEVSMENWNTIVHNLFKTPTATAPKYVRHGSPNGKLIEVAPNTVTMVKLEYYYRLSDLALETDVLGVPAEIEELVLLDVQRRVYEKLEDVNKMQAVEAEYQLKFKQYVESYIDKRTSETAEKERLQSADTAN